MKIQSVFSRDMSQIVWKCPILQCWRIFQKVDNFHSLINSYVCFTKIRSAVFTLLTEQTDKQTDKRRELQTSLAEIIKETNERYKFWHSVNQLRYSSATDSSLVTEVTRMHEVVCDVSCPWPMCYFQDSICENVSWGVFNFVILDHLLGFAPALVR